MFGADHRSTGQNLDQLEQHVFKTRLFKSQLRGIQNRLVKNSLLGALLGSISAVVLRVTTAYAPLFAYCLTDWLVFKKSKIIKSISFKLR